MDLGILETMDAEGLRTYLDFLLWHYRGSRRLLVSFRRRKVRPSGCGTPRRGCLGKDRGNVRKRPYVARFAISEEASRASFARFSTCPGP